MQSLINVSHIKDYDSKAVIDALAEIVEVAQLDVMHAKASAWLVNPDREVLPTPHFDRPIRKQLNPALSSGGDLPAEDIATGLILIDGGKGHRVEVKLPDGAAMDRCFDTMGVDDSFDFSAINISGVNSEDALIVTNLGWVLVGNMNVKANAGPQANHSFGTFRAHRTGVAAWTLYRIA